MTVIEVARVSAPRPQASLPLLTAQLRNWVSHHKDPDNPRHNCGTYFRLTGDVQLPVLQAAVAAAYAETEALRVVFHLRAGHPWQRVIDAGFVPVETIQTPDEAAAIDLMNQLLAVPFELGRGDPPCSHLVLETAQKVSFLFFRHHRILLDTYGAHRYLTRVAQHYNSLVGETPLPPGQFAALGELVREEKVYLGSPRAKQDSAFWREVVAGPGPPPRLGGRDLPARPRTLRSTLLLPEVLRSRLVKVSRRYGVPSSAAVVAALAAHLSRTTGSPEVLLGLTAPNRTTPAAVRTPANLANDVPLRVLVHPEDSFADLLRSVSRQIEVALTHQRAPLERLRRPPTPRTLVTLVGFGEEPSFAGCASTFHILSTGPVWNFRLNCHAAPAAGLLLEFEVNPGVHGADQLEDHQEHVLELLGQLAHLPEASMFEVLAPTP
jgi:hypothetical protein